MRSGAPREAPGAAAGSCHSHRSPQEPPGGPRRPRKLRRLCHSHRSVEGLWRPLRGSGGHRRLWLDHVIARRPLRGPRRPLRGPVASMWYRYRRSPSAGCEALLEAVGPSCMAGGWRSGRPVGVQALPGWHTEGSVGCSSGIQQRGPLICASRVHSVHSVCNSFFHRFSSFIRLFKPKTAFVQRVHFFPQTLYIYTYTLIIIRYIYRKVRKKVHFVHTLKKILINEAVYPENRVQSQCTSTAHSAHFPIGQRPCPVFRLRQTLPPPRRLPRCVCSTG